MIDILKVTDWIADTRIQRSRHFYTYINVTDVVPNNNNNNQIQGVSGRSWFSSYNTDFPPIVANSISETPELKRWPWHSSGSCPVLNLSVLFFTDDSLTLYFVSTTVRVSRPIYLWPQVSGGFVSPVPFVEDEDRPWLS